MKKGEAVIKILFWFLLIIGGIFLSSRLDKDLFEWKIAHNSIAYYALFVLGVFLLVTIINISRNTGRYLAKNAHDPGKGRGEINRLVTTGPYAMMRHPMHLGLMLTPMAVALIGASPSFILLVAPLEMMLIFILIKTVEEPQQIRKFGDEYRKYMKKVPMFCLKKPCLQELFKPQSL